MINLVRKFIITVSAFAVLTVIYLLFTADQSVFWAIYSFSLKDAFIIALCALFIGQNKTSDLFAIGVGCYLIVPTIIRLLTAFKSNADYELYRELLSNSEYSYFLLLVLFFIAILIYHACRNGRKN
jgi:hypothetical protein